MYVPEGVYGWTHKKRLAGGRAGYFIDDDATTMDM